MKWIHSSEVDCLPQVRCIDHSQGRGLHRRLNRGNVVAAGLLTFSMM